MGTQALAGIPENNAHSLAKVEALPDGWVEVLPVPRSERAIDLRMLWQRWINTKTIVADSIRLLNLTGRQFCAFMIGKALSIESLQQWYQHVKTWDVSPRYADHTNSNVRGFLRWLYLMHYVPADYAIAVPSIPKPKPSPPKTFTEGEYEAVKAFCRKKDWAWPYLWLWILGYRTGMSLVDCCHLRWKDICLSHDSPSYIEYVRIKNKRFGDRCYVPIIPFSDLWDWLWNFRKSVEQRWKSPDDIDDYVLQAGPLIYNSSFTLIRAKFRRIFVSSGLTPYEQKNKAGERSFRHLRCTFISNLVNAGIPAAAICTMTGHTSVAMMMRYVRPNARVIQDGLARAFAYASNKDGVADSINALRPVEDYKRLT